MKNFCVKNPRSMRHCIPHGLTLYFLQEYLHESIVCWISLAYLKSYSDVFQNDEQQISASLVQMNKKFLYFLKCTIASRLYVMHALLVIHYVYIVIILFFHLAHFNIQKFTLNFRTPNPLYKLYCMIVSFQIQCNLNFALQWCALFVNLTDLRQLFCIFMSYVFFSPISSHILLYS